MKAKKELSYEDALNKAADYCARSERSRNEVLQKMFCWGVAAPDAARIADWLEEKKSLSTKNDMPKLSSTINIGLIVGERKNTVCVTAEWHS